ncbi:hypothetical protein HMPREF3227_02436 [Corynebacterium sp. CMW7794]|nr:hypothetical protein HMPREF3227_02436 [Corynebacterium sp. CMW7794]
MTQQPKEQWEWVRYFLQNRARAAARMTPLAGGHRDLIAPQSDAPRRAGKSGGDHHV